MLSFLSNPWVPWSIILFEIVALAAYFIFIREGGPIYDLVFLYKPSADGTAVEETLVVTKKEAQEKEDEHKAAGYLWCGNVTYVTHGLLGAFHSWVSMSSPRYDERLAGKANRHLIRNQPFDFRKLEPRLR